MAEDLIKISSFLLLTASILIACYLFQIFKMEKFKLKLLNPRSSELRRRFGSSLKSLFKIQDSVPPNFPDPFKKKSLFNRLKVNTSFSTKENQKVDEGELTPVKKLPKVFKSTYIHNSSDKVLGNRQSWIKPRDPETVKTSKRFWSSLDTPLNPLIFPRKSEPVDLWTSFNSTPVHADHLDTVTQSDVSQDSNSSYYSLNSSIQSLNSFYSINSFYSVNTSICNTPQRELPSIPMDCEEYKEEVKPAEGKRRLFKAKRK